MISWYQGFTLAVLFVCVFATDRDRAASRIILAATIGSSLIVHGITHYLTGSWKLVFPGMTETLTILALLRWSRNRTGFLQSACLVVAWVAHFTCFIDIKLGTDLVYSRYEAILAAVAVAQIAAFHDTIRHVLCDLVAWVCSLGASRVLPLRHAGGGNSVFLSESQHQLPKNPSS